MNQELNDKWNEAQRTGKPIPVGNLVVCDVCDRDYTDSDDVGGFLFSSSYAYCPKCAVDRMPLIRRLREEHLIRAWARPGEKFREFVIRLRGPDATISVGPISQMNP